MKNKQFLIAVVLMFQSETSDAAGVAIVNDLFDGEKIVIYKEIDLTTESGKAILNCGSQFLTIDKFQLISNVEVLDSVPQDIINETETKAIRAKLDEFEAFAKKFPQSETYLANQRDTLRIIVKNLGKGQVRSSGKWISRSTYNQEQRARAVAAEKLRMQQEEEQRKLEEQRLAEQRQQEEQRLAEQRQQEEQRIQMEAFARSQRAKGLELYNGEWIPSEELKQIRIRELAEKREKEKQEAIKLEEQRALSHVKDLMLRKTINEATYSVFQIIEHGIFVRVIDGKTRQGGINTDLILIVDADTNSAAEGDRYKGTLYWCGNYTYPTKSGNETTVNAYCLDEELATQLALDIYLDRDPGAPGAVAESGAVDEPTDANPIPSLPEPLRGVASTGSGFFVGDDGYFVTNAHVVRDSKSVRIFHEGEVVDATLISVQEESDLALLKTSLKIPGIQILSSECDVGEDAFALGYPNPVLQGLEIKVTKGVISSKKGLRDDDTCYQIDAAVQPGSSGGPLCDKSGRLIGVIVSGLNQLAIAGRTGNIPQNVNYAIKSREVESMLKAHGVNMETTRAATDIKSVTAATVLVLVR